MPSWLLNPGKVLLRNFRRTKFEPLVQEVELIHANPQFATVRFQDGRQQSVSVTDLAPGPVDFTDHRRETTENVLPLGQNNENVTMPSVT